MRLAEPAAVSQIAGFELAPDPVVAAPPAEPGLDAAHLRAREAARHYAPAEPRALGVMAGLAVVAILWVVVPVGIGVLVGALLAFASLGFYRRMSRRFGKPTLVAVGTTMIATAVVAGTLAVLVSLLVVQGVSVLSRSPQWFGPDGSATLLVQELARPFAVFRLQPSEVVERLRGALGGIATALAGWAAQIVGVVFDGLLALFFMALTMYYVLRHWPEVSRRAEYLLPINPHHTRRLMREIRRIGRTVIIGNFGTAVIQGAIAGVGYAVARVPEAAFFGAITAVASLVPVFGTLLVWLPAGVVLVLTGHAARGFFELAWGAFAVVTFCDYVVRPKLVGRGDTASTWMTFVGIFGGIKAFGAVGLLFGPLLVGVASSILRLYGRTRRFRLGLT
jgi:predicted PurR-regulated permease PerM